MVRETVTQVLRRVDAGEAWAQDDLFAAAYSELKRLAGARLREGGANTVLNPTSLVHESYLRFAQAGEFRAADRRAFFSYASQVMRSVIVDSVRERQTMRRGSDIQKLTLITEIVADLAGDEETILKVHEALLVLEDANPRLAEVAQMRYFGGYTNQEIANVLGLTERSIERDWEKARIILEEALR